jgi:hypothetical protein
MHFDFKVLLLLKWRTLLFEQPPTNASQHGYETAANVNYLC